MLKFLQVLRKALKNKVLHYMFSRYATYFIQFINSLFIAVFLGPYYLGIWGFITLIIQYLNQINLGIAHSVNAIVSIHKNKEEYVKKIIGTSFTMLIILSLFLVLFFAINKLLNWNLGTKYNFSTYAVPVVVIGILANFNTLFSSIFRIYGRIIEVALNQSSVPVFMLVAILLFKGKDLLWALVGANFLAFFLSFILYLIRTPVKIKFLFIPRLIKVIQIKGWHLFVYNSSFYLIIISTKTLVSNYFSVDEFGYFTFAFALSNTVLLLLQAISFLIYPKLLNRFAHSSNKTVSEILNSVRDTYISVSHGLIHFAIMMFPFFLFFFPKYQNTANTFHVIALAIVLHTNSFGYQGLLIAKRKEQRLGLLALFALILNIIIAYFLIEFVKVRYYQVIYSVLFSYIVFVFLVSYYGRKSINSSLRLNRIMKDAFPVRIFFPFILSLGVSFLEIENYWKVLPFMVFMGLNASRMPHLLSLVKKIINNPKFINV
ncbi:oligosaccharide flippase family protein [Marinilabilia sp.]|uniref:oligosaccharide flippase family protein n=1 Tax=Marinilabilia sp. TaxID=2021252 RepID=UPI0025C41AFF|nr:oligosaccharide flippase family protein [Marinilabilia sp.]